MYEKSLDEIIGKIVAFSKNTFGDKFQSVILYGSYARGDYDDESDMNLENGVFLTSKLQSKTYFEQWKNTMPFYQNVIKDGVVYA